MMPTISNIIIIQKLNKWNNIYKLNRIKLDRPPAHELNYRIKTITFRNERKWVILKIIIESDMSSAKTINYSGEHRSKLNALRKKKWKTVCDLCTLVDCKLNWKNLN